jgi:hydrogenase maturation protease
VIGIGSLVRSDDAAGRVVAERIAAVGHPDVEVVSLHQLTPEVAPRLAGRRLVVFVDAAVDTTAVTTRPLATDGSGRLVSHHLGPAGILALAGELGWAPAAAVLVSVPASDLAIGTELSAAAAERVEEAIAAVLALVG